MDASSGQKTMLIKAAATQDGYILLAENGDKPTERYEYKTPARAYAAAAQIWPAGSVWRGEMTQDGYRIVVE